jgi:cytochrome b subunit of formate dehydrogenase
MMAETTPTPRRPRRRTDAFTVILHWGMVAAVVVSLLSGLRIAADYAESVAGGFAGPVAALLLEGSVIEWHVWSGWILTFIAISYGAYLWRSHQAERVKLDRSVWRRLRQPRPGRGAGRWSAANVVIYQLAFALVGLMAVTGWMLYSGVTLGFRPYTVATVHGLAAYGFVVYVVVHVVVQIISGAFWQIFRPRLDYAAAAGLAVIMAGAAVTAAVLADRQAFDSLLIAEVAGAPVIDGSGADPAWREVRAATIRTLRGANLDGGEVSSGPCTMGSASTSSSAGPIRSAARSICPCSRSTAAGRLCRASSRSPTRTTTTRTSSRWCWRARRRSARARCIWART